MEAGITRRGLVIGMAGLLLLCLLAWFTLSGGPFSPLAPGHDPSTPADPLEPGPVAAGGAGGTVEPAAIGRPPSGEEAVGTEGLAYGGKLFDSEGRPLAGVVVEFLGSESRPSGEDGSFSIPLRPSVITMTPTSWALNPLRFRARGYSFRSAEPRAAGFDGRDRLFLPLNRGPRIKLWWFDSRAPAADLPVVLKSFTETLDSARTGSDGTYLPLWSDRVSSAVLDVEVEGVPIRYALVRKRVMDAFPYHLFVPSPDRALRLDVECVTVTGRPPAEADFRIWTDDPRGMRFDVRPDARGRATFRFWISDASSDPGRARLTRWSGAWKTASGRIHQGSGLIPGKPPAAGRVRIALRRGEEDEESCALWVVVRDHTGRRPALCRIGGSIEPRTEREPSLILSFESTPHTRRLDPEMRLPRRVSIWTTGREWPWPDSTPVPIGLSFDDREPVRLSLTTGVIRRAVARGEPVVLTVPPPPRRARWVKVVGPKGDPVRAARVVIGKRTWRRYFVTDGTGKAWIGSLPAAGPYRIVAIDPATGDGGEFRDYVPATAPRVVELPLLEARPLQFRVLRKSGAVPGGLSVALVDREKPALLPRVYGKHDDDNLVTTPPVALELYHVSVRTRRAKAILLPATEVGEMVVLD